MSGFRMKELSTRTWPDYQRFFSQGHGWDHCGCTAYQGFRAPADVRKWKDKRDWALKIKCDLVERHRAHGILVYDGTEPIGWCQFGPKGELPITEDRRTSALFEPSEERVWKITCFCTHKDHRGQGVAELALRAALQAIRKRGGGRVDAFPIVSVSPGPQLDELIRKHGGRSAEVRRYIMKTTGATDVAYYDGRPFSVDGVFVHGMGPMAAVVRRMSGLFHPGTATMFEREGFKAKEILGTKRGMFPSSRLLMQRTVRATPKR